MVKTIADWKSPLEGHGQAEMQMQVQASAAVTKSR
jgi:hypothetical protein